ncbi:MAG: hypothetical protein U1F58_03785 [Burkholderiales bacterium]
MHLTSTGHRYALPRPGRRRACALLAATLLLGMPGVHAAEAPTGAELRRAPTRVTIDGRRFTLTVSLWRDLMPSVPPQRDGRPLQATLAVGANDGRPFPAGIRVTRAWIVVGDAIWEAPALEEQDAADPAYRDARGTPRNRPGSPVYRVVVRGGPAWEPGTRADVVVRLTDAGGRDVLLRVPRQTVMLVQ